MTLLLPHLKPVPQRQAAPRATAPPIVRTLPVRPLPAPPPLDALPSAADVQGLGRALFGCAPEAYANLSPEDRAHCPKPGVNTPRSTEDELYPRSHAKDAATWQEDLDERHHDSTACFGAALVAQCMVEAEQAEHQRAASVRQQIESDKRKAQMPAAPPVPRSR